MLFRWRAVVIDSRGIGIFDIVFLHGSSCLVVNTDPCQSALIWFFCLLPLSFLLSHSSLKRRLGHVASHQAQRMAWHLPAEAETEGLEGAQDEAKLQK